MLKINEREIGKNEIFVANGQMVRVVAVNSKTVKVRYPNGRRGLVDLETFVRINQI